MAMIGTESGPELSSAKPGTSGTKMSWEEKAQKLTEALAGIRESPPLGESGSSGPRGIQNAPYIFRSKENLQKYFIPEVYSFGPIHHGNPTLHKGEMMKLKLAATYIRTQGFDVDVLLCRIKQKIQDFKQWYDKEIINKYNDIELSWMFFIDGCALLYYIIDEMEYRLLGKRSPVNFSPHLCHADVFTLENQLPCEVLSLLMIKEDINPTDSIMPPNPKNQSPDEILCELMKEVEINLPDSFTPPDPEFCINVFITAYSFVPFRSAILAAESVTGIGNRIHILDVLWKYTRQRQPPHPETPATQRSISKVEHVHYGVKELKKVGVRLKPGELGQQSKVSFEGWIFGSLTLAPVRLSPMMASQLANLMAYEMCPDHLNDFPITSYVCFLKSLVHDAQDVAAMKSAGILHNTSSDEAAIELLTEMASGGSPNPRFHLHVKLAIAHYFKSSRWKIRVLSWIVEAAEVYFRTPWTTVAFLAAAFALALTATNTIFTILHHSKHAGSQGHSTS